MRVEKKERFQFILLDAFFSAMPDNYSTAIICNGNVIKSAKKKRKGDKTRLPTLKYSFIIQSSTDALPKKTGTKNLCKKFFMNEREME